eukprot:2903473-Lingulodinium_polyedra.AAC.1
MPRSSRPRTFPCRRPPRSRTARRSPLEQVDLLAWRAAGPHKRPGTACLGSPTREIVGPPRSGTVSAVPWR